eukprot:5222335-Amphidinium_carterae.1
MHGTFVGAGWRGAEDGLTQLQNRSQANDLKCSPNRSVFQACHKVSRALCQIRLAELPGEVQELVMTEFNPKVRMLQALPSQQGLLEIT